MYGEAAPGCARPSRHLPSRRSLGAGVAEFHPQFGARRVGRCATRARGGSVLEWNVRTADGMSAPLRLEPGMADKAGKRKAKAKREKSSVLGNLPATRPQRLGRPRTDTPEPPAGVEEPPPRPKRESPRRPPAGPARVEATPVSRRTRAKPAAAKPAAANGHAAPAAAKPRAARPAATKAATTAAATRSPRPRRRRRSPRPRRRRRTPRRSRPRSSPPRRAPRSPRRGGPRRRGGGMRSLRRKGPRRSGRGRGRSGISRASGTRRPCARCRRRGARSS